MSAFWRGVSLRYSLSVSPPFVYWLPMDDFLPPNARTYKHTPARTYRLGLALVLLAAAAAVACSPATPCERYCQVFGACRTAGEREVDACTAQCEAEVLREELDESRVDLCGRCAESSRCVDIEGHCGGGGPCGGL